MTRRRVAITGIGLVTALGVTREATWAGLVSRAPAASGRSPSSTPRAIAAASPPKSRRLTSARGSRRSSAGAGRAAIGSASSPRPKRWTMPGCSTGGSSGRASACSSGAGTGDLLRNERYQHTTTIRGIEHARPSDAWNHFSSTPVDVIASALRSRRPALVHRRRLLLEHDRDRPGRRRHAVRPRRRGAGRRHRRAGAADVQRLQRAAADGSGAVPAVRSRPRRDEHRRRRRHPGARGPGGSEGARGARSTPSSPATPSPARRSTRRRRSRTARRSGRSC